MPEGEKLTDLVVRSPGRRDATYDLVTVDSSKDIMVTVDSSKDIIGEDGWRAIDLVEPGGFAP